MGTYNIEIEKNSQRINSLEDWYKLGGPKKENQWKDGRSGGRNHDLYLEQSGEIVIGVEAKADETLGKLIS